MRRTLLGLVALILFFSGGPFSSSQPVTSVAAASVPIPAPIRVLVLGVRSTSAEKAVDTVFSSGDLVGTSTRLNNPVAFNAMTPGQLRASYDIIFVTWSSDTAYNLDWSTRVHPFLNLGGGVIYEDPNNIGDLAPVVIGASVEGGSPFTFTASVPGLTDGILGNFANWHTLFTAWNPAFQVFMTSGSATIGLYGEFGGRMVLTGPDQDYHSDRPSDQYNFLVNEISWAFGGTSVFDPIAAAVNALPPPMDARSKAILLDFVNRAKERTGEARADA